MRLAKFFRSPLAVAVGTVSVLLVLVAQAHDPRWAFHLTGDVGTFAQQGGAFLRAWSWEGLRGTEYQPGALWFFVLPSVLLLLRIPYLIGMFLINGGLIVLHVVLLAKLGGMRAAWIGLLLFLAAGPVSLFRFELLVSFLVLLSLWFFLKQRSLVSGALLGCATAVKVYPVFLLPLLAVSGKNGEGKGALRTLLGFLFGVGMLLGMFFVAGGTLGQVQESLTYHTQKSVAVQSLLGTMATVDGLFRGHLPRPVNAYGIHGLLLPTSTRLLMTGGLVAALVLLSVLFALFGRRDARRGVLLFGYAVVLSLVVWPTAFQPQYLLWPLAFTALLPVAGVPRATAWTMVGLHALALLAMQIPFPMFYTAFLDVFYRGVSAPLPVAFSVVSISTLVTLYVLSLWAVLQVCVMRALESEVSEQQ